ncbi:recombination directionality factor [Nocardioides bruguierae]|uniref:recombination directionality factor n=1 Tax=Nocardioides bruguierae TaxID=2945102 RepID=UPI00202223D9|nr:hypothetical protein [Nocardioides bruguierae]MCL8026345.1 hypothetical protein [Nocardioides bruguierae]
MPISPLMLQRRHAELGRIRLGQKGSKGQPQKLDRFRFTSVSERYIRDLAELYGGTATSWDNGGVASWEVFTDARSIPVIAVKGGLSQWLETWSGGGCVHRCDGEVNAVTAEPCDPNDRAHQAAKPTTRLSVMLPELEAIGVWRLESHGWNAAAEIPAVAELAQFVGDLVPAHLNLQERRAIKDGKTSRFVVPVLDLQIGQARLREVVNAKAGTELAAPEPQQERPALAAAPASSDGQPAEAADAAGPKVHIPSREQIEAADLDLARQMVAYLEQHDLAEHPATAAARARVAALEPKPDADGVVDAELVPDAAPSPSTGAGAGAGDADAIWQQILKRTGDLGWDSDRLVADFKDAMGVIPDDAAAAELGLYLERITTGEAGAA